MASALQAAGHQCLTVPVLAIEELPAPELPAPVLASVTIAIFLSEHAVGPGLALLARLGSSVQVLAVGPQTARVLEAAGVVAAAPAQASSEGLLAVPPLAQLQGEHVLVCSGEGGRDVLAVGLAQRGAVVTEAPLYRRVPVPVAELAGRVRPDEVDAIVVSSGDGLRSAARVWFEVGGTPAVRLFAPSQRVASIAQNLGFERVTVCAGASPQALLEAMTKVMD